MVAFEDGFFLCDPSTGGRVAAVAAAGVVDEYEQLPNTRLNDGRQDARRGGAARVMPPAHVCERVFIVVASTAQERADQLVSARLRTENAARGKIIWGAVRGECVTFFLCVCCSCI